MVKMLSSAFRLRSLFFPAILPHHAMSSNKQGFVKSLKYALITPALKVYLRGLWQTSRYRVYRESNLHRALTGPCIPCYWHQQNIACALFLLHLQQKWPDFKPGFLVSPSRDGQAPAQIFQHWGATVIRGSSSRTGAQALRDLYRTVNDDHVSPANTPDGPRGPIFEFKLGPLMLAQMTGAPILPMAYAARRAWLLRSWDQGIVPKWFNTLTFVIGEPVWVPKGISVQQLEPLRLQLQTTLQELTQQAGQYVTE